MAADIAQQTALHLAAQNGYVVVVKVRRRFAQSLGIVVLWYRY